MAEYIGDEADNFYFGTADADQIFGNDGSDTLRGADGNDTINGGNGDDALFGQIGDDRITGDVGNDRISGGEGKDSLNGGEGDDVILGGAGDDTIAGGAGRDRIDGGDGFDRFSAGAGATEGAVVDLRRALVLNDGFGNRERITSVEALVGTAFVDVLYGNDVRNIFDASRGDDLSGFGGDDLFRVYDVAGARIDGGDGLDSLNLSDDRWYRLPDGFLVIEKATDDIVIDLSRGRIINDGFGGTAKLVSIENVYLTALRDERVISSRIIGSDANNRISSNEGDDRLFGMAGDDWLDGYLGKDQLSGGAGADTFAFAGFAYRLVPVPGYDTLQPTLDVGDSAAAFRDADRISDFSHAEGDRIDLFYVDAISRADFSSVDDDAFTWLGTARFTGAAGEARYDVRGGNTFIYLEVNGEAGVDMIIRLDGVHTLIASDFIL